MSRTNFKSISLKFLVFVPASYVCMLFSYLIWLNPITYLLILDRIHLHVDLVKEHIPSPTVCHWSIKQTHLGDTLYNPLNYFGWNRIRNWILFKILFLPNYTFYKTNIKFQNDTFWKTEGVLNFKHFNDLKTYLSNFMSNDNNPNFVDIIYIKSCWYIYIYTH